MIGTPIGQTEEARTAGRAGGWPRAKGGKGLTEEKNKNMTEERLKERMDVLPQKGGDS